MVEGCKRSLGSATSFRVPHEAVLELRDTIVRVLPEVLRVQ